MFFQKNEILLFALDVAETTSKMELFDTMDCLLIVFQGQMSLLACMFECIFSV